MPRQLLRCHAVRGIQPRAGQSWASHRIPKPGYSCYVAKLLRRVARDDGRPPPCGMPDTDNDQILDSQRVRDSPSHHDVPPRDGQETTAQHPALGRYRLESFTMQKLFDRGNIACPLLRMNTIAELHFWISECKLSTNFSANSMVPFASPSETDPASRYTA